LGGAFAFGATLALEVEVLVLLALVAPAAVILFAVAAFLGATAVFGLAGVDLGGGAGLFSFAEATSAAFTCGVNLMRPEGPLGSTKMSFSAPFEIALESNEI